MNNRFTRIGLWWVIWIVSTIVFIDFLPQHPHLKYETLLSPFILIMGLIIEPFETTKEIINRFDPSFDLPGIFFWVVTLLLFIFPRKQKN